MPKSQENIESSVDFMPVRTLFIEEWKANNELFKWHEDLKQKRFTHFLTLQTALLAICGVLIKDAITIKFSDATQILMFFVIYSMLSLPSIFLGYQFLNMDKRARAYVDTVKAKLLIIESNWMKKFPEESFSTYSEQFSTLVHRDEYVVSLYTNARGIGANDPYIRRIKSGAAHIGEEYVIRFFIALWIVLSILPVTFVFLNYFHLI